jgi:hypothetical protein
MKSAALLAILFAAVVGLAHFEERVRQESLPDDAAADILYVQSPTFLTRAALSYDALVADIYWIRAVQYYGRTKVAKDEHKNYSLLYPLLDLTTSVDPYFNIAYRFGAIFLSERYPAGAGRPDLAIALLEKGLRAQPAEWHFAEDIGFVHYWSSQDYITAAHWFSRAAAMPNAPNWLKPLAAVTLAQGGSRDTSRRLWTEIMRNADAKWLQVQGAYRLQQLDAMDGAELMERVVMQYRARTGTWPRTWYDVIRANLLRGIPVDPTGFPFHLDPATGRVTVDPASGLSPLPGAERPH